MLAQGEGLRADLRESGCGRWMVRSHMLGTGLGLEHTHIYTTCGLMHFSFITGEVKLRPVSPAICIGLGMRSSFYIITIIIIIIYINIMIRASSSPLSSFPLLKPWY